MSSNFTIKETDKISIDNFLSGVYKNKDTKNNLDFLFAIENNSTFSIDNKTIQDLFDYKKEIIENKFNNIENKTNMIFNINDNDVFFHDKFIKRFDDINNIVTKIKTAITEKTSNIKLNSFEKHLKDAYVNNSPSVYFGKVCDYFKENLLQQSNRKEIFQESFFLREINRSSFSVNIDENYLQQNLIVLNQDNSLEFLKPIKTTSNDIVIQSFINLSRSLYTLSTNCFNNNYNSSNFQYIDYDQVSLKNLISEVDNFNIFDYINESNKKLNYNIILKENKLKSYKSQIVIEDNFTNNSYILDENITKYHYLPNEYKNYINSLILNNYIIRIDDIEILKDNIPSILDVQYSLETNQLNKAFYDNIFNINIRNLNQNNLLDIKNFIVNNDEGLSALTSSNEKLKFNINNINKERLYINKKPLIDMRIESSGLNITNREFSINKDFSIDNEIKLNELEYKFKIDDFIKSLKRDYLVEYDSDIDLFNEIISNIKKSDLSNIFVSYCKDNEDSLSIIDEESQIFNLMFTQDEEDEDIIYSHSDLITNHKINKVLFLGLDKLNNSVNEVNQDREDFVDNFKQILSYYYPKNEIFSSSTFFHSILDSICKEAEISNFQDYEEYSLSQAIYLNYFNEKSSKKEIKDIVAKRFLKSAIYDDTIFSGSIENSKMSDFEYDIDSIFIDDFDNTSQSNMSDYLNQILDSSQNLKKIKNDIFSSKNIDNLNKYKELFRISDISLDNVFFLEDNPVALTGIMCCTHIPFHSFIYNFIVTNDMSSSLDISLEREIKNKIDENIVFGDFNEETGEREIIETKYTINKSSIDVTNTKKIKVKFTPKLNREVLDRESISENRVYSYSIIEDYFTESCDKKDMSFNFIINIVKKITRLLDKNYESNFFNSESEVDDYISSKSNVLEKIIEFLEIYSKIYILYFNRIQRLNTIKIFNWLPDRITKSVLDDNFPKRGKSAKHKNIFKSFKYLLNSNVEDIDITTKDQNISVITDIKRLVNNFKQDSKSFLNSDFQISTTENEWNSKKIDIFNNILSSLYKSDYFQAINFDIVNGYIEHQNYILNLDTNDITSSRSFTDLKVYLSEEKANEIENNFYNVFYVNSLSKSLFKDSYLNFKYENYIKENTSQNITNFYKKSDLFSIKKQKEILSLNELNLSIDENNLSKEAFGNSKKEFINSNFYNIGIKKDYLDFSSSESIIKITVKLIDNFNLNHYYIPKVYLFSPLFTSVNTIFSEDYNISNDKIIGFFNLDKNIDQRLEFLNYNNLLQDQNKLINIIANKLNLSLLNAKEIFKYLVYCHVCSNYSKSFTRNIYDIKSAEKNNMSLIEKETYSKITEISDVEFFNIFDCKKEDIKKEIKEFDNGIALPSVHKSYEYNTYFFKTLGYIDNIGKLKNINQVLEENYYDTYMIPINFDSYYYIDIMNNSNDSNFINYETNDFQKIINLICGVDKDFISSNNLRKTLNIKNNFSVVLETEII